MSTDKARPLAAQRSLFKEQEITKGVGVHFIGKRTCLLCKKKTQLFFVTCNSVYAVRSPDRGRGGVSTLLYRVHGGQNLGLHRRQIALQGSSRRHGVTAAPQQAADLGGVDPAIGPGAEAQLPLAGL